MEFSVLDLKYSRNRTSSQFW